MQKRSRKLLRKQKSIVESCCLLVSLIVTTCFAIDMFFSRWKTNGLTMLSAGRRKVKRRERLQWGLLLMTMVFLVTAVLSGFTESSELDNATRFRRQARINVTTGKNSSDAELSIPSDPEADSESNPIYPHDVIDLATRRKGRYQCLRCTICVGFWGAGNGFKWWNTFSWCMSLTFLLEIDFTDVSLRLMIA